MTADADPQGWAGWDPPGDDEPGCGHRAIIRGCSACEEYLADWVAEMARPR